MPASAAQQVITAERRKQAIQMKLAGVDYETIAVKLGYANRQAAREDIRRARMRALKEVDESVEELRMQELERLDRLQAAFWGPAIQGDPKAGDMVLKVMVRRAKFCGYDSAIKVEVSTIDQIDAEIRELRERLAANDLQKVPQEM